MGKKLVLFVFVISLLFLTYSFTYAADVIKLKFANYFPPTHMNSIIMDKYCKELTKRSNGKLEITHYTGGTLLTAPKIAVGIASGIADIGLSHCSYTRGRFPVMEIMELPLGFPSSWVATHAANDFYNKFKPKEWDTYHTLMFSTSPPCVVQTLNKPVKTLDDIKALKIRGTGRIADITKALGATPMPLEMVDVYESLRRGVLDGNLGNFEQMKGFRIGELLKFNTTSWKISSVNIFYVVVNKNKWNSLPPDMQKLITDYTKEFLEEWAVSWNDIEIEGREFFLKQGGQIVPISDAEIGRWVKAVEPVIAEFKKDLVTKGYKPGEVDSWISFLRERIEYWKGQEKVKNIPTAYQY
ncbi:MAG: TRAP transporter substrate-binding protein [Proteobacteria bacterium]|jgi:TRAP-type C4-dicarboxylate transport system substrate-binding protein|nr:TRAP transporter substrate-binding protein [Pseudomonadota bacterium]